MKVNLKCVIVNLMGKSFSCLAQVLALDNDLGGFFFFFFKESKPSCLHNRAALSIVQALLKHFHTPL